MAVKIDDASTDDLLPAEMISIQPVGFQLLPQNLLSLSHNRNLLIYANSNSLIRNKNAQPAASFTIATASTGSRLSLSTCSIGTHMGS